MHECEVLICSSESAGGVVCEVVTWPCAPQVGHIPSIKYLTPQNDLRAG